MENQFRHNPELTSRDLSPHTWKDFEDFFSRFNGVQGGCWCMYYHGSFISPGKTNINGPELNRESHKKLVEDGKARGILIYSGPRAIGWCQYGTREELPRPGNGRIYRTLEPIPEETRVWRITCFFVDMEFRRRGVAKFALSRVLQRIREAGGGIVEAFPVTGTKAYTQWFGNVSMYRENGFTEVAVIGKSNVLMRCEIKAR